MRRRHVLAIDDDETDLRFVKRAFRPFSDDVVLHTAVGGAAGLAYLQRETTPPTEPRPDLILLDLNMPGLDGYDVLERIKGDPDLRQIPVVIFSTSSDEQHIARAYDEHANSFVTKPADFGELQRAMRVLRDFWFGVAALRSA